MHRTQKWSRVLTQSVDVLFSLDLHICKGRRSQLPPGHFHCSRLCPIESRKGSLPYSFPLAPSQGGQTIYTYSLGQGEGDAQSAP